MIFLLNGYRRDAKAKIDRRMRLLLQHFGINEYASDKWERLCLALASAYVPGFRTEKPPGAKRKWSHKELRALRSKVEHLMRSGMTASDACYQLKVAPGDDPGFPKVGSARTLYRRYQEAKGLPE